MYSSIVIVNYFITNLLEVALKVVLFYVFRSFTVYFICTSHSVTIDLSH